MLVWKDKSSPHCNRLGGGKIDQMIWGCNWKPLAAACRWGKNPRLSRCFVLLFGIWSESVLRCVDARSATLFIETSQFGGNSFLFGYRRAWSLTFHPVNHLTGAPLAHGLHNQCHGRSLSCSRWTKEKKTHPQQIQHPTLKNVLQNKEKTIEM